MHNRAGRLVAALLGFWLLSPIASASGATAVQQWQQIFHPAADGTTSAAPIAARELADGTVLVVTQAFQTVHYNHDGTIVSAKQLSLSPPDRRSRPARPGVVQRPEAGPNGAVNAHAVIDGFGRVVIAVVDQPNHFPVDAGNIETIKFDGLTGEALWPAPQLYHPTSGSAFPTDVFVDRQGDVVVTGLYANTPRHVTIKYDGRTGMPLWGPVLRTDLSNPLWTSTSAMDLDGNVYVSYSVGFGPTGMSTLKYSGLDGSILWGPVALDMFNTLPSASVVDTDGNFVVYAGAEDRFVAVKYDSNSGSAIWGPRIRILPAGAFDAAADSISFDANGDLALSGRYRILPSGAQFLMDKISGADGSPLWSTPPIDVVQGYQPVQSAVAGNGDVLVGAALGTSSDPRLNFWRYRGADGAIEWGPLEFSPIAPTDPAQFFVGSNGRVFTSELVGSGATAALNSGEIDATTGTIAWGPTAASFPHVDVARSWSLAAGPEGNPVVTGFLGFGLSKTFTLKYDRATGNPLWGPVVYAPADAQSFPTQVAVDASTDVLLLGFNENTSPVGYQTFLFKYSGATGAVLWGPVFMADVVAVALGVDASGNAVVLTATQDAMNLNHLAVSKFSGATGSVLWGPVPYNSGAFNQDLAFLLSLDPSGNPLVVGQTIANGVESWLALKYSGADGSLIWGPASGSLGHPYAAAVDASGNLAVSGNDENGHMTTLKYSGVSGLVLWGSIINPAVGGAVAVAPNGDVVAAGDILNPSGTHVDFVTVRYRASDGSVVWGPVVTDAAGGNDVPLLDSGLAFDASGNVVLGGTSQTFVRNNDIALIKYAGGTGATLWGPVYLGGSENESLQGLDVRGDSIVVGATSQAGMLTAMLDESLGIETPGPFLTPAFCGQPYNFQLVAQNGTPGYTWTIVSGSLPSGLSLSSAGAVAGTPTEQGTFTFTVRVTDSTLAHADREFQLVVTEDPGDVAILAFPGPSCHFTLAVPPGFASYLWLPGGETTSTIDVAPIERTTYGVVVGDGSGCLLHLSVTIPGIVLQNPACLGPSVDSITPSSGPASGGTAVGIAGGNFELGLQLEIGGQSVGAGYVDTAHLNSSTPALSPGTLNDVVVVNPDSGNAALLRGFLADFLDVPPSNIFHDSIERLFRRGVTAGCDAGVFCPDADTTRAQMAVFLLKSLLGSSYVPPPATGGVFGDVYPGVFAADWIEDLYSRGITTGCQIAPPLYCPDANISRAEMAVFLLKTLLGSDYVPPPATGTIFGDVGAGDFAAAWIEDLYNHGLTAGCQAAPLLYCPLAPVSRGEMAAFLVTTFGL